MRRPAPKKKRPHEASARKKKGAHDASGPKRKGQHEASWPLPGFISLEEINDVDVDVGDGGTGADRPGPADAMLQDASTPAAGKEGPRAEQPGAAPALDAPSPAVPSVKKKKNKKRKRREGEVLESGGTKTAEAEPQQRKRANGRKKAAGETEGTECRGAAEGDGAEGRERPHSPGAASAHPPEAAGDADVSDGADWDPTPWAPLRLHPALLKALRVLGFREPTPIQSACIPAAAHQGKDVVGAAETGSGKTLAFGLPILQRLLEEREKAQRKDGAQPRETQEGHEKAAPGSSRAEGGLGLEPKGSLRALVLTPTRELALQVCSHMRAVCQAGQVGVRVVPIVGGMAPQKQQRLLRSCPEVVVATPGRLWELMSQGETHLLQLGAVSFLVLDEADRMVDPGRFQELKSILALLPQRKNTGAPAPSDGLPPAHHGRGRKSKEHSSAPGTPGPPVPAQGPATKRRQVLVFSATLAVAHALHGRLSKGASMGPTGSAAGVRKAEVVPGAGAMESPSTESLVALTGLSPSAAMVDLTPQRIVASKVAEAAVECVEEERDVLLLYLLRFHSRAQQAQPGRTSGPSPSGALPEGDPHSKAKEERSMRVLVFCSAISSVRRLAALLKLLEMNAQTLHSQQQQRQRLKALDRFKQDPGAVMVATDVAARGLDIPGVRLVVHFQLPHSADVYVHRCGRTARAAEDGCSVALVCPKDAAKYRELLRQLGKDAPLPQFPVQRQFLPQLRHCVEVATRLDKLVSKVSKDRASETWEQRQAAELGVDLGRDHAPGEAARDSEEGPDEKEGGKGPGSCAMKVVALKKDLKVLLQKPLRPASNAVTLEPVRHLTLEGARKLQDQLRFNTRQVSSQKRHKTKPGKTSGLTVVGMESMDAVLALRKAIGL